MTQANPEDHSHVKVPDDKEVVYFEGRPVLRGEIGFAAMMIIIGAILILIPFVVRFTSGEFPSGVVTGICIVLGLILPFTPMVFTRTVRYKITSYRIDFEHGILSKNIDTLELWHVDDITYHQSLADRVLNVGNITVVSNDSSTPKLELKGLPNARSIFDSLKYRIIAVKRQRGVIKFDSPG